MRGFLHEVLGVPDDVARGLWSFRQVVHGANALTPASTADMSALIMALQSAISLGVGRRLGHGDDDLPRVAATGLSISSVGLSVRLDAAVAGTDGEVRALSPGRPADLNM